MVKKQEVDPVVVKGRDVMARAVEAVDFELARITEPPHRLRRWQFAKWLAYLCAKEDAADSLREELARTQKEIARVRRAKGTKVRVWVGRGAPWANRTEQLEALLEELNAELAHTLVDEMESEQDMARDDRDCFYDEDMWDMGAKYDPDFNKPIVEWANIEVEQ